MASLPAMYLWCLFGVVLLVSKSHSQQASLRDRVRELEERVAGLESAANEDVQVATRRGIFHEFIYQI